MSEELLPCPFCGRANLKLLDFKVWCDDCHSYGPTALGKGEHIFVAWNRRTPAPEGEVVAWRLRRVGVVRWNLWDLDPRVDTPAYADAAEWEVQPLYASPVVPVGRDENTRTKLALILDKAWSEGLNEQRLSEGKHINAILAALGTRATDTGRE
jgi:hypothetical protein